MNEQQPPVIQNQNPPLIEPAKPQGGSRGAMIGSIIIIIVLILGGLYVWTKRETLPAPMPSEGMESAEDIMNLPDNDLTALTSQSNSDELSSIEKDLNETGLQNLEVELGAIEQELNN